LSSSEVFQAPYSGTGLKAVYYPGPESAEERPLIVFCGGYDSTLEELYFILTAAALQRGYSMLTFEGPGQGSALREQGLIFTHEWEKPTAAVLDAFLAHHARPGKMVLVGMSMGGLLAPRAAAFDARLDGVVAFDVLFETWARRRDGTCRLPPSGCTITD
jgi:alpha-beta hydrolase superfamily lysophospholipase